MTVTQSAAAPVVTIKSPLAYTGFVHNVSTVQTIATFTDVASSGPWTCKIAWGDGSTSTPNPSGSASPYTCTATHMYTTTGTMTITVTATNKFSAAGSKSVPVIVS